MNKTKWILPAVVALALGAIALIETGCGKKTEEPVKAEGTNQVAKYTCPMHPEVVKDGAGKCPKCGMDLVVKK